MPSNTSKRPPRPPIDPASTDPRDARIALLEQSLKVERLARERAELRLAELLRRVHGAKSEKFDSGQLTLLRAQLDADQALADVQPPSPAVIVDAATQNVTPKKKGGGRKPAPMHLPIEVVRIDPPVEERVGLKWIRDEITEETEYHPARYIRRQILRGVWVRENGEGAPIMAPLPPRVIPQSGAGTGLITHTLVAKYVDHCPLARQEKIAARSGVELSRQKLGRWVEAAAHLLITVRDQLADKVRASGYIQADETPVKVLDPDRGGKAALSYLWTYHAPLADAIVFDFNLSRGRDSPERFIPEGWGGALQSDGYELYASLGRDRPRITRFGCMAHCRRKIADAIKAGDANAVPFLEEIAKLYAIEKEATGGGLTDEQRGCLRHAKARPILKKLQRMFQAARQTTLPKSALGEAARYAVNQWPELARYAKAAHGRVRIDNNPVERGIRPTKLGMRNWLFIGHPDAGWRSAVIYSIVGTCKLLGINPEAYLNWVLPKLAAATTKNTAGLLPHDYATINAH
jgi:transposase